jgi:hypothetical protein
VTFERPAMRHRPTSVQTYVRVAAVLFLISMVTGYFGELHAPSRIIVWGDAAATARNVTTNGWLLRLGFASYLVEAACDVALSLVFYVLLRPVHKPLALLAAFLGLVSTSLYAVAEIFYFAPLSILGGADYLKTFSPEQLGSLALLSFRMFAVTGGVFMVFYGLAMLVRGYLIYRSGFLPKALGAIVAAAGLGFIAKSLTLVLAPAYSSGLLLAPMFLAGLSLTLWLFVKGVDVERWEAAATQH